MNIKKHVEFFIIIFYIVLGYMFLTEIFPNLLRLTLPFVLAFIVAAIANPLAKLLRKKLKFPGIISTAVSLLAILSVVSGIITLGVNRLITELTHLVQTIPDFSAVFNERYYEIADKWELFHKSVSPEFSKYANDFAASLTDTLSNMLASLTRLTINSATNIASQIPAALVFTVAFILSSIFITNDYDKIKHNIMLQIPESVREKVSNIKQFANSAFRKYLKGMLIIMCITFVELIIGMAILKVEYVFTFAIIIAIVDILPIFGTGTILIPWAAVSIIFGNFRLGFGLLILYGVISVIRQFIEPKIISKSLGTYPLLTLFGMYVGLKLFGVTGMIIMPVVVLILVLMHNSGIIKIWNSDK